MNGFLNMPRRRYRALGCRWNRCACLLLGKRPAKWSNKSFKLHCMSRPKELIFKKYRPAGLGSLFFLKK